MPGLHRNLQFGPDTVGVSQTVLGGQLVMPDGTTGLVKPATAAATTVLGIAWSDANPAGTNPTSPLNTAWPAPEVAVQYGPADVDVTYASAAAYGQLLLAAANGQVGPAGVAPASDQIVGRCTQPAGVSAGAVGRMRLIG
jgi:hypothetical protein